MFPENGSSKKNFSLAFPSNAVSREDPLEGWRNLSELSRPSSWASSTALCDMNFQKKPWTHDQQQQGQFGTSTGVCWSSLCKKGVLEPCLQTAGCRQKSPEEKLLEMTGRHFQLGGWWEEEGKSLQRNGSFYRHGRPTTKKNLFFCSFVYNAQSYGWDKRTGDSTEIPFEISGNYFCINRKIWLMTPGRMITEQNIFSKNKNEDAWEATQGKLNQNKPISILRLP